MNLQITDPRAHELARKLAEKRKTSLTDAVIAALEAELKREANAKPLSERAAIIADRLRTGAGEGGRDMTKDEIDAMWGHS